MELPRDRSKSSAFAPDANASGARIWLAPEFRGADAMDPDGLLNVLFGLPLSEPLRSFPGRETLRWPGQARIVKRMVGGDARESRWERRRFGARSSARREAENLRQLAAAGIAVPRALAWVEAEGAARHPRRGGRSALVMEAVDFADTLRDRFGSCDAHERRALGRELVDLVARFHGSGWIHRDLYLQHVVVQRGGGLVLLDLGRARQSASHARRWFVKDLAALALSAPAAVTRADRLRFLRAWLAARGVHDRAELRRWGRRIARKARRMGAHRPRHLDPRDPVDATYLNGEAGA